MRIMRKNLGDEFSSTCRKNYIEKITPAIMKILIHRKAIRKL